LAECPENTTLVGGGAVPNPTASGSEPPVAVLGESVPSESNSWSATAVVVKTGEPGSTLTVRAYALCAR
jgi:hypothetical protein